MSARVHEIFKEDGEEETDIDHDLDDDSLHGGIEKNNPTAAQIEVIYSISQCFKQEPVHSEELEINNEEEDRTVETAWIAVFEGMLSDGTEGSEELLRWKLVDNRPAWEFPGLTLR